MKIYAAMREGKILGLYLSRKAAIKAGYRESQRKTSYGSPYNGKHFFCEDYYVLQFNLKGKSTKIGNGVYLVKEQLHLKY